jgi:hypothetical protein
MRIRGSLVPPSPHTQEIRMYGLLASLTLALAPAATDDAASKELAALAQKVKDAESYSFTFMTTRQSQEKEASPWRVEFKKKLPYHYQRGDVEFFKLDEKYVLKGKDGKWTLADPAKRPTGPMPKAGGASDPKSGGDEGGDEGKQPDPAKKGERRSGLDRIVGATEVIPLPHRLFNDFAAKFAEVTKEEKDGKAIFHAKMTPAFVREVLNSRGGRPARPGGKGEGKAPAGGGAGGAEGGEQAAAKKDVEASGTMNVTAKGDVIESIEYDVEMKTPSADRKGGGTITLSSVNATNLVLPKEVETALGIGAAPEKK